MRGALAGVAVGSALREPLGPQRQRSCTPDMPLADAYRRCAAMSPFPPSSALSRWYNYQAIVTPDPGTRRLALYLYADVFKPGELPPTTTRMSSSGSPRSFSSPWLWRLPGGMSAQHQRSTPSEGFSPDWIAPAGNQRVEVDGLRNGWLGPASRNMALRFGPSVWYLLSRFASLFVACLLLALALFVGPDIGTD